MLFGASKKVVASLLNAVLAMYFLGSKFSVFHTASTVIYFYRKKKTKTNKTHADRDIAAFYGDEVISHLVCQKNKDLKLLSFSFGVHAGDVFPVKMSSWF